MKAIELVNKLNDIILNNKDYEIKVCDEYEHYGCLKDFEIQVDDENKQIILNTLPLERIF